MLGFHANLPLIATNNSQPSSYRTHRLTELPLHRKSAWRCTQKLLTIIAEGAADTPDALRDAVVGNEDAGPDHAHDLVAVDKAAGVLDEKAQQHEGFGPKRAFRIVGQQHTARKVQDEAVESVYRQCFGLHLIDLRQLFQKKFSEISD
jgi:hypothetical protein